MLACFKKEKRSVISKLKRIGPETDPCGTPDSISTPSTYAQIRQLKFCLQRKLALRKNESLQFYPGNCTGALDFFELVFYKDWVSITHEFRLFYHSKVWELRNESIILQIHCFIQGSIASSSVSVSNFPSAGKNYALVVGHNCGIQWHLFIK